MSERRLRRKLEQESRLPTTVQRDRDWRGTFSVQRSGLLTASVVAVLLLVFGLAWRAHQHAQFHRLTADAPLPPQAAIPLPGGQEAVTMTRILLQHNAATEFASATLLPGLGMQALQLTVNLPNRGIQPLLAGPSLSDFATNPALQSDTAPFHFMVSAGEGALAGWTDIITWKSAKNVSNKTQADGGEVTADFNAVDADGVATGLDANLDVTMTGRYLDLDARLHNGTNVGRELSFDWSPRFRAPTGTLSDFRLSIPAGKAFNTTTKHPADTTPLGITSEQGETVPDKEFDVTYADLRHKEIGDGPVVVLTEPQSGLVLRFVLLTPSIRSVRVRTNPTTHTLTLSFGTDDGTTHDALGAGQSARWRVRVEVSGAGETTQTQVDSH